MNILSRVFKPQQDAERHALCLRADHEVSILFLDIDRYRKALRRNTLNNRLFPPDADEATRKDGGNFAQRFAVMQNNLSSITCYVRLRTEEQQRNLPDVGVNGKQWLRGYRKSLNELKDALHSLRYDVILSVLHLIDALRSDVKGRRCQAYFSDAMALVYVDLIDTAVDKKSAETRITTVRKFVRDATKRYKMLPPWEKVVPGISTLTDVGLEQQLGFLVDMLLLQWEDIHGVHAPMTFEALLQLQHQLRMS